MRTRSVSVLVALLVVTTLAACGDDGPDLEPYVDAVAADLAKAPEDDSPPFSEEQARCAAEHAIDAIDEDVITGFDTPEDLVAATEENLASLDLDDATLDTIADDIVACVGGVEFFVDFLTEAGVSDEQVDCVRDSITEDELVGSVRADLAGETNEVFDTEIGACLGE
jgi:predicted small lipoprotein YifL